MNKYSKAALAAFSFFILCYYFVFDPAKSPLQIPCLFHKTTGWLCFGCGGQRSLHALLHGRIDEALHLNFLVFPVLLLGGFVFYSEMANKPMHKTLRSAWLKWSLGAIVMAFMVIRNIPT